MTVTYRPDELAFVDLVRTAKQHACATKVWTTTDAQLEVARAEVGDAAAARTEPIRDAKASDQLYYVERSTLRHLPLTPLQTRRVNAALYLKQDPAVWLSPRQRELHVRIERTLEKSPDALATLRRPGTIDELAAYRAALVEALE